MLGALPGAVDSVSTDLRGGGWEFGFGHVELEMICGLLNRICGRQLDMIIDQ